MYVRVVLSRKLSAEELMLLSCGVGEDSWESPGLQEIQPFHPKESQPWIFIGRTDAEAETPILWPPDVNNWLVGKDPDAGKDWRREEKGMTEDEIFGWHHWHSGHEFQQAPGVGQKPGQRSLACCSPWGHDWLTGLTEVGMKARTPGPELLIAMLCPSPRSLTTSKN